MSRAIVRKSNPRKADGKDAEVARRVRSKRLERGISQDELAKAIGVNFQQVCEYEKGAARIASTRLYRIAQTLETPITFFFDPSPSCTRASHSAMDVPGLLKFVQDPLAVSLLKAFRRIKKASAQRVLVRLAEALAFGLR
jgi:transcriptional regulator with XRE-family HTH domain